MGTATSTVSTEAGNYNLPSLRPGIYRVEAEKRGFKRLIRDKVVVEVAVVAGLNLALEVGDVSQSVTVSATALLLQSENSEDTTPVNPKAYLDLPLNASGGRNPASFLTVIAGTVGGTPFTPLLNRNQVLGSDIQVDGIITNYPPASLMQPSNSTVNQIN